MISTVLVTGSHTEGEVIKVFENLDRLYAKYQWDRLVTGGADYIDTLAAQWAQDRRVSYCVEFAKWNFGGVAGPIRNDRMLRIYKPELVISFGGG